jgi:hypothetical protein
MFAAFAISKVVLAVNPFSTNTDMAASSICARRSSLFILNGTFSVLIMPPLVSANLHSLFDILLPVKPIVQKTTSRKLLLIINIKYAELLQKNDLG